jgi:hypothetical protein
MTQLEKAKAFLIPKLGHVVQFLMKQGIAVAGNLVYGLLCVRLLPVPDYAKFAVLFGYMGSLTMLLDIGITGTVAPLVGEQVTNLQLIADYVASLRRIALKLYLAVAPIAILVFAMLVEKRDWGFWVVTQMIAVLLVTAWFARISSSYGLVLILRRDRARYYRTQIIGSLGSLTLLLVFYALHRMNIYVGILLNVAQVVYIATAYYRRAQYLLGVKGKSSQQKQKAIVRLARPNLPGALFYALQGQVTLMLITVFGHSAASIANIGALNRLSQILVFFSQMNPILVEPFFARLPVARLKRTYLLAVALVAVCASAFAALAFLFPKAFLWILGPHYSQLRIEVGLAILASAIQFTGGFIWVINTSRRFVYWWNNFGIIVITLLVQAVCIWKFDLSVIRNVLVLNVASACASLLTAIACAVYGFIRGPQQLDASHPDETSQSLNGELNT